MSCFTRGWGMKLSNSEDLLRKLHVPVKVSQLLCRRLFSAPVWRRVFCRGPCGAGSQRPLACKFLSPAGGNIAGVRGREPPRLLPSGDQRSQEDTAESQSPHSFRNKMISCHRLSRDLLCSLTRSRIFMEIFIFEYLASLGLSPERIHETL